MSQLLSMTAKNPSYATGYIKLKQAKEIALLRC